MKRETVFECHCGGCAGDEELRLEKFQVAMTVASAHLPQILHDVEGGNPVAMAFMANIGAEMEIVLAKASGNLEKDDVSERLFDDRAMLDYMQMICTPSEELYE